MVNNNSDDLVAKLSKLSDQERNVLKLRCQGLDYKTIHETLFISVSAVKQYMSRAYVKLGLDLLPRAERMKALYETYCPLLKKLKVKPEIAKVVPKEVITGEVVPDAVEPVPPEVEKMVDEDEYAIVLVAPAPLTGPEPKTKPRRLGFRGLIVGVVLGIFLGAGALYLILRPPNGSIPLVPQPASTLPASTVIPSDTPLPSATQEIPTQTPVIVQQIVVVTATPPPPALPTVTEPPSMALPFEDTFDLRARPEWEIITGTWRVLDGHFTADTNDEWQIAFVGDSNWRNYKIEVTSFSKDFVYPIRVIARAGNEGYIAFEYYAAGARWLLVKNGKEQEITQIKGYFNWDKTYKIAVEAKDDIYTAYVNGLQYSQIQDTTYSKGRVGIGFSSNYLTWFDDFRVIELP